MIHIDSGFLQQMTLIVVSNIYGVGSLIYFPPKKIPITNSVDKVTMFQKI